jgi:hypothetical protein
MMQTTERKTKKNLTVTIDSFATTPQHTYSKHKITNYDKYTISSIIGNLLLISCIIYIYRDHTCVHQHKHHQFNTQLKLPQFIGVHPGHPTTENHHTIKSIYSLVQDKPITPPEQVTAEFDTSQHEWSGIEPGHPNHENSHINTNTINVEVHPQGHHVPPHKIINGHHSRAEHDAEMKKAQQAQDKQHQQHQQTEQHTNEEVLEMKVLTTDIKLTEPIVSHKISEPQKVIVPPSPTKSINVPHDTMVTVDAIQATNATNDHIWHYCEETNILQQPFCSQSPTNEQKWQFGWFGSQVVNGYTSNVRYFPSHPTCIQLPPNNYQWPEKYPTIPAVGDGVHWNNLLVEKKEDLIVFNKETPKNLYRK